MGPIQSFFHTLEKQIVEPSRYLSQAWKYLSDIESKMIKNVQIQSKSKSTGFGKSA